MGMVKSVRRMRCKSAFTLVELMIVVVIVAILALVAIPLYQGSVTGAKMSEGIAGCGTIRSAFRVYAASHNGVYPVLAAVDGTGLTILNVQGSHLAGKYFTATDYAVTADAASYSISATLSDTGDTYIIDQDGNEGGTYTTE